MCPANSISGFTSTISTLISQDGSNQEDPDIWFNAIDHVEMDDTWFEGAEAFSPHEEHHASPSSSAGEAADSWVPFTEDCRRGVQQFLRTLGEYGESRMLSACLSGLLPGIPASLITAADSLYTAVTERRNIDTAALHALGLASGCLPENINAVSWLATFIRDTVTGWTDETFLQQFLGNEENHTSIHLFTALAVTAIAAGRWMKDEGAPQRGVLKVPAFMANIFIRASHYWTALGNMVSSLPSGAEIPENTGPSQRAPAFEIDTWAEMTGNVCDTTGPCSSAPRLTAFSSNSTAHPEAYTRATVQNRPAPVPGQITRLSVPEQAHYLATEKLRKESGLSDLMYCTNLKTETRQQINEKVITDTYFNTKCGATAYPEPLTKGTDGIPVHADIPETQVSSAATSQSSGDVLLPLVAAAVIPAATAKMQALKSKTMITAGVITGLTGSAIGGKMLWNKLTQHNAEESKLKTNTGEISSIFAQHHVGSKPVTTNPLPAPSTPWFSDIPDNADLQSAHFDFNKNIAYDKLSDKNKKLSYFYSIKFVLLQLENDESLSTQIRKNAYNARIGMNLVVPVDIKGYKLNNVFILLDEVGSKTGVLVNLDAEKSYCYISRGRDIPENIMLAMPSNSKKRPFSPLGGTPSGMMILNYIRREDEFYSFGKYFNFLNPNPVDIYALSEVLANNIQDDYKSAGKIINNKLIMSRAISGAHIPDPGVSAIAQKYEFGITWDNLTPAEYLRSFAHPFSILSGEMQLISSSENGESIQQTELSVHKAEYIGSWIDITVGTVTSLTPAGWVLNTAQSVADIIADLSEGQPLDPLAVAGLIIGCITDNKLVAKIAKFNKIAGKGVKYGMTLGQKVVDLAIVEKNIRLAKETGEPLAIYQAFLAAGMSVKDSYNMAKIASRKIKISKSLEESAQLEQLEALQTSSPEINTSSSILVGTFKIGQTLMKGRIKNDQIEISNDNGVTWIQGNKLHLLAFRLQNAGGKLSCHRVDGSANEPAYEPVNESVNEPNKSSGIKNVIQVYHNGHPAFTNKQADFIKKIKANKEDGFYYVPRENNNQNYYGNGNIYVQEKMGDSDHYPWGRYVEMNGELVPVRNTQHQGQGVLYEVYDMKFPEKAGHPIEWDGNRWLFERKTSVHISKDLKNLISPEMAAEKVDAGKLSAPDHQGLRYDAGGNKYIKVRNKYVRIYTHKHGVFTIKTNDKNVLFLRFKHGEFRPETINERLSVILKVGLSGRGEGFANLPLKEHKMSDFKISGQNKDLLFPEYGVHLENKQPDLVDYAAKFEQLTPSEKESIHKWTMKPSSEEIPDSLKLNMHLREEVKLTDELNALDKNLSSALSSNLPKKTGDMIRFEQYFSDEKNPWLNGNLKVGDYLSDRGYLSFSGKDNLIKNVMIKNIKTQNKELTCHVFYRVKNANNGFYLPEKIATTGKNVDEVLYSKGQVFKINDISIALSKKAGEPHRVAVDLEEVKPDETIPANIGNWHIGKSVKIDRPASFSLSLSDLLDSGPSVPKKRRQQR